VLSRDIYIFTSLVSLFLFAGCFVESVIKKNEAMNSVANVIAAAFASILFFLIASNSQSYRVSVLFYSIYYSMMFVVIITVLHLVIVIEGHKPVPKSERIGEYIFFGFALIDISIMVLFPNWFFELRPVYGSNAVVLIWCLKFKRAFIFHEIIEYAFSLKVVQKLAVNISKAKGMRKTNFKVFLVALIIEQIFNIVFSFTSRTQKFNYTPIICGIISVYIFNYLGYKIPRNLKDILASANEKITDAVICFDYLGNIIYSNEMGRKVYAVDEGIWVKKYADSDKDILHKNEVLIFEGEPHTFSVDFKKIYDEKLSFCGFFLKLSDRTLELANIQKENYRATHDELTKLYNRSHFFNQCEQIIRNDPDTPRYMIASNIRNFKLVNDLFGTKFGDELLVRQAEMFNKADFKDCIKGRVSADRFAMLINKADFNPELAVKNTDFVREIGASISFPLTMQLGLYEIADVSEKTTAMYNKAVLALKENNDIYSSKCTLSLYDSNLMKKILAEKNIIREFEKALKDDSFKLYLQAQVDSKSEKCLGAEVLVRWCEKGGFKNPDDFIPVLEKGGLIYQLDHLVWEKSVELLGKWQKEGKTDCYLSINISMKDFYYLDLYDIFTGLVEKYEVPPSRLNLELTESVIMDNGVSHRDVLKKLQNYGFKIEMDDFGSGYSSLNVLKDVAMDVIKIDKEFLHQSGDQTRRRAIIVSVIQMAKALGMTVIVEGVETEVQKDFLRNAGVDVFQGYYFSMPINVEDFEKRYLEVKE